MQAVVETERRRASYPVEIRNLFPRGLAVNGAQYPILTSETSLTDTIRNARQRLAHDGLAPDTPIYPCETHEDRLLRMVENNPARPDRPTIIVDDNPRDLLDAAATLLSGGEMTRSVTEQLTLIGFDAHRPTDAPHMETGVRFVLLDPRVPCFPNSGPV